MIRILAAAEQSFRSAPAPMKVGLDLAAVMGWFSALFGIVTGLFGALGAMASFAWVVIRIYETRTVQAWLSKRHSRR